jgi:Na+-driven multidrug efflux pump
MTSNSKPIEPSVWTEIFGALRGNLRTYTKGSIWRAIIVLAIPMVLKMFMQSIFALLPSWGISNAAAVLVGQNLGAKQPDRAERSIWYCTIVGIVFLSLMGVIFWINAEVLVRIFVDSPEAIRVGVQSMRMLTAIYPIWAIGMVTVQSFNGAGDTTTSTWIQVFAFWAVQIPIAWWLSHSAGMGTKGVFAAIMVAQVLSAFSSAYLFKRCNWKLIKV